MPSPFASSAVGSLTIALAAPGPTRVAEVVVEELVLGAELDVAEARLPARRGRGGPGEGIVVDEAGLDARVRVDPVLQADAAEDLELARGAVADAQAVDRDVDVLRIPVQVVAEQAEGGLALGQRVGRGQVEEARVAVIRRRRRADRVLLAVDGRRPGLDVFRLDLGVVRRQPAGRGDQSPPSASAVSVRCVLETLALGIL